jgi:hypothetical protein
MNKYSGSNFDDFLEEEGILEEVGVLAQEQLKAFQTEKISTDTEQLNQLFDTDNTFGG